MSVKTCFKCKEYFRIQYPGFPDIREDYFHVDHTGHPIALNDSSELGSEYKDVSKKYSFLV